MATSSALKRLEDDHAAPREQGRVDLERRVLGRGPDQADRAVLDRPEQGVLLRLVEAMDLVDEEDRPSVAALAFPGLVDGRPNLAHAGEDRGERDELRSMLRSAIRRARVVLPVPGGPQRMSDDSLPARLRAVPSSDFSPTTSAWPTNSSRLRGRIRSANGASARAAASSSAGSSNRLPVSCRAMEYTSLWSLGRSPTASGDWTYRL